MITHKTRREPRVAICTKDTVSQTSMKWEDVTCPKCLALKDAEAPLVVDDPIVAEFQKLKGRLDRAEAVNATQERLLRQAIEEKSLVVQQQAPTLLRALQAEAEAVRLRDLVRYCRGELHKQSLITDEEYATLLSDDQAVARLHTYDDYRHVLEQIVRLYRDSTDEKSFFGWVKPLVELAEGVLGI